MEAMKGFALLELLVILVIIVVLALVFVGATKSSLFTPGTAGQVEEGNNAIQQAQNAVREFNHSAGAEQSSTDQLP